MSNPIKIQIGIVQPSRFQETRKALILDILARGKVAVFTNEEAGVVKKVCEWKENEYGDILAFHSTGRAKEVAWDSDQYSISEEYLAEPLIISEE